jgi:hypothetical protein
MSVDAKDKNDAKFAKSSLRARNKTVVMEPSSLEDFRGETSWQDPEELHIDDLLDDDVSGSSDEAVVGEGTAPSFDLTEEEPDVNVGEALLDQEIDIANPEYDKVDEADYADEEIVEDAMLDALTDEQGELMEPEDTFGQSEAEPLIISEQEATTQEEHDASGYEDILREGVADDLSAEPLFEQETETYDDEVVRSASVEQGDIVWRKPSRLVGFLVALDSNQEQRYVELHEGRLLVSKEENASENCLVLPHPSVSTMHAIMMISADGSILILDQLSEHGTVIKRAKGGADESLMGDKQTLFHGDVVVFGECAYNVCIIDTTVTRVDA